MCVCVYIYMYMYIANRVLKRANDQKSFVHFPPNFQLTDPEYNPFGLQGRPYTLPSELCLVLKEKIQTLSLSKRQKHHVGESKA